MKAPATQFYWKDWTSDIDLRRCSLAAQGAWLHVLALMHTSPEYGVLRWPLKEIADAAGVPMKFLRELSAKNVLKGSDRFCTDFLHIPRHAGKALPAVVLVKQDGGCCWFSARFVRDEWARGRRGVGSRFTADNQPSRSPDGRMGEPLGDGPASASAFAFCIDRSTREEITSGGAADLALALRENGYSHCSAHVPELIAAKEAGVTPQELSTIAKANAGKGKSIAYLAATAIGKRRDKADRDQDRAGNSEGATRLPADPAEAARRTELERIDHELYDLVHLRDHLQSISSDEFQRRVEPLKLRQQELKGAVA